MWCTSMQPHLPLRLRGPDSGSGEGSHIATPMRGERHYVPSYNSESLRSRRVGLGLPSSHLILFSQPQKGTLLSSFYRWETRVLWFARDRKLHAPVLAPQPVLKSSDILFHLQPCFWLPQAYRASSGSVCTNDEAIWHGRHPDHLGNVALWGLACLLLRPQQRGCCGLWDQQILPGLSGELGESGAIAL